MLFRSCRPVERDARPTPAAIDSCDDALLSAVRCQPQEWLTVLIDSMIYRGIRSRSEIELLCREPQSSFGRALGHATAMSESGTESLTMVGLRRRRLPFRQQVWIGRRRVDFLIGDRLIVEVDGADFHNIADRFESDRLRDRELVAQGYVVIRLTYWHVMLALEAALDDICRVVARGDHRF